MKMQDSRAARSSVNQAPLGTFVSAEDKKAPSRAANTKKNGIIIKGCSFQTNRDDNETMQVVIKVTRMTQTP